MPHEKKKPCPRSEWVRLYICTVGVWDWMLEGGYPNMDAAVKQVEKLFLENINLYFTMGFNATGKIESDYLDKIKGIHPSKRGHSTMPVQQRIERYRSGRDCFY